MIYYSLFICTSDVFMRILVANTRVLHRPYISCCVVFHDVMRQHTLTDSCYTLIHPLCSEQPSLFSKTKKGGKKKKGAKGSDGGSTPKNKSSNVIPFVDFHHCKHTIVMPCLCIYLFYFVFVFYMLVWWR